MKRISKPAIFLLVLAAAPALAWEWQPGVHSLHGQASPEIRQVSVGDPSSLGLVKSSADHRPKFRAQGFMTASWYGAGQGGTWSRSSRINIGPEAKSKASIFQLAMTRELYGQSSALNEDILLAKAQSGNIDAQVELSRRALGRQEWSLARQWAKQAADSGSPMGSVFLGLIEEKDGNTSVADEFFDKATVTTDQRARFLVSLARAARKSNRASDQKVADVFRESSDAGLPVASFVLGVYYLEGEGGVGKDVGRGFDLIRKASVEAGPELLFLALAAYSDRKEPPPSPAGELAYFQGLADRGNVNAKVLVGAFYLAGIGTTENESIAVQWLSIASGDGNGVASALLSQVYKERGKNAEAERFQSLSMTQGFSFAEMMAK